MYLWLSRCNGLSKILSSSVAQLINEIFLANSKLESKRKNLNIIKGELAKANRTK